MTTNEKTHEFPQRSPFKTVLLHGARFRAVPAEPDQAYTHDILVDLDGGGHVASVAGYLVHGETCEQTEEHVAVLTASAQMLTALVDLRNAHERGYDLPWDTVLEAMFAGFGAPSTGTRFMLRCEDRFTTLQGPIRLCAAGTSWRVTGLRYNAFQRVIVCLADEAGTEILPSLDELRMCFREMTEEGS